MSKYFDGMDEQIVCPVCGKPIIPNKKYWWLPNGDAACSYACFVSFEKTEEAKNRKRRKKNV